MSLSIHSDEHFMREALKQAEKAFEENEIPVGAVVVCNNRIISRAYNQTEKLTDSTAHAEMLALTSAFNFIGAKYLQECSLYVTLEPCNMCAGALYWSQISKIIYAASDQKRGFTLIGKKMLHPKTEVIKGVLLHESKQLLEKFFNTIRK